MTSETAACESPRCSARDLRLTLCPEGVRARKIVPDLGRGIEISCKVSHIYRTSHKFKSCSCRASVTYPDRKSTRLNSSHSQISYAVFCLKKKTYAHLM